MTPKEKLEELRKLDSIRALKKLMIGAGIKIGDREQHIDYLLQEFSTYSNEQSNKAVYGFHEYIIGKNLIRPEADQAFNYGRLHHAIDDYIAELRKEQE